MKRKESPRVYAGEYVKTSNSPPMSCTDLSQRPPSLAESGNKRNYRHFRAIQSSSASVSVSAIPTSKLSPQPILPIILPLTWT
jgi:hypothetical protein